MSLAHDLTHLAPAAAFPSATDVARIAKPALLSVDDAKRLAPKSVADLFVEHQNPGQLHFMKLLGFHNVIVERAEGPYYIEKSGRKILDFFGGFGSLAFGHNHPRILEARRRFAEEKRHDIGMAFLSQYAAALAKNIATISPGDLDFVFLGSTGSEAVEAAIKVAEQAQGASRSKIVYAENAFHGKTKGALSLTDSTLYRSKFRLVDGHYRVPIGDLQAIQAAVDADPAIGIVVLETIQGGAGIVEAPTSFWQGLRALCDRHGLLWVADEVQCGVGRTGQFYAFEHHGVVPDVTALAKSLGGGKAAMAAMIARADVYKRAYGTSKTAMIHGPSTFGGMGEACVTAIEALNVLYDEDLMGNAERQGVHLMSRLRTIQAKYPKLIKEVRGRGLMVGLELQDFSQTLPFGVRQLVSALDDKLKGSLAGFLGNLLLRDYNILVAFTEYNRNVIRLEPPLVITREHVDQFADALDDLLSRGVVKIVTDFLRAQRAAA
jgi:acetylornithine/succinyldiaminopimelate/putrescine aminotransferase